MYMIRGIIFDCFGVLCQGSLEALVAMAKPEVRQAVIDTNHAADRGFLPHDETVATMADLLEISTAEIKEIIKARQVRVEPMFELARSLKPRYKLGMLSNVGGGVVEQLLTPDELTNLFDAVVLSGEVGAAKPYGQIYEITASRLGLRPDECVMIDDLPKNVEGAEIVGMKGIVCGSPGQVVRDLHALLSQHNA